MTNFAPEIFRQRLLIEGYYATGLNRDDVTSFLLGLPKHLGLRTYGEPIIHSPEGIGKTTNEGYDAFIPLIDSGLALYVWSEARFFSVVLYSCKQFSADQAAAYCREFFHCQGDLHTQEF